jgi:hypothetical protein
MEETYKLDDVDALLEELKGLAVELNEQILLNCPMREIECIIGQLKLFYISLNSNEIKQNLLAAINKHISPKITKEELLSFGEPDEVLCIDR